MFYHISHVMNDPKLLAILTYKNISFTSNHIKKNHPNTYLYFENYFITIYCITMQYSKYCKIQYGITMKCITMKYSKYYKMQNRITINRITMQCSKYCKMKYSITVHCIKMQLQ